MTEPQQPLGRRFGAVFGLLSGFAVGIGLLYGAQMIDHPAPQLVPLSGRSVLAPLEVVSWHVEPLGDNQHLSVAGEVRNQSNTSLNDVMALAVLRTRDGSLITSEHAMIQYQPILPGQASPFEVLLTDNPAADLSRTTLAFSDVDGKPLKATIPPALALQPVATSD